MKLQYSIYKFFSGLSLHLVPSTMIVLWFSM